MLWRWTSNPPHSSVSQEVRSAVISLSALLGAILWQNVWKAILMPKRKIRKHRAVYYKSACSPHALQGPNPCTHCDVLAQAGFWPGSYTPCTASFQGSPGSPSDVSTYQCQLWSPDLPATLGLVSAKPRPKHLGHDYRAIRLKIVFKQCSQGTRDC